VSVPPREQEQEDPRDPRREDEAGLDGPGQVEATAVFLPLDLGHDLLLTTGAGDGLRFVVEIDFRTGSLRWGTLLWYLEIVLSWSTGSED